MGKSMKDVMNIMDAKTTKREEFVSNLRVFNEKKYQNVLDRKNAQANDEKRKCEYLKAINKISEKKDEYTLEI